ncbi:MAG: hypothetical protein LVT47_03625 [Cyanobacteria bacterium LVE1205-1]
MAETGVDLANPRQGRLKTDNIPVALRQLQSTKGQQMQFPWLAIVAGFGSIALVGMAWVAMPSQFKEMIITQLNSTAIQSAQSPNPPLSPPCRQCGYWVIINIRKRHWIHWCRLWQMGVLSCVRLPQLGFRK